MTCIIWRKMIFPSLIIPYYVSIIFNWLNLDFYWIHILLLIQFIFLCWTWYKLEDESRNFLHQTSSSISSRNQVLSKQRLLTRYFAALIAWTFTMMHDPTLCLTYFRFYINCVCLITIIAEIMWIWYWLWIESYICTCIGNIIFAYAST